MKISKNQMENIFENSRCKESSADPNNRNDTNKDRAQCLSTSLTIQDLFGGELIRQDINIHKSDMKHVKPKKIIPHFLNKIDGETIDLATAQFKKIGETSKRKKIQIIDKYKRDIITIMFPQIQESKEILAKIVKKELSQLLKISQDELEKYLLHQKIQLTD